VDSFLARQDDDSLLRVFDTYKERDKTLLSKMNLKAALADIGCSVNIDDVEEIFSTIDTEDRGALDFEEFKRAAARPSKVFRDLERWTTAIPFNLLVATAYLPIVERASGRKDPLRVVSKSSEEDLISVCNAVSHGCLHLCKRYSKQLREAFEYLDKKKLAVANADDQSKFAVNTMSCGSISAFYDGLGSRVGRASISPLRHRSGLLTYFQKQDFPICNSWRRWRRSTAASRDSQLQTTV
jgi:Ca2+-binding EF-hand superfamily protein